MNCLRRLAMSNLCDWVEGLLLCEAVASSSIRTDCDVVGVGGVGVAVVAVAIPPSVSASICGLLRCVVILTKINQSPLMCANGDCS